MLAVFLSVLVLYGVYSGPITALLGGQKANSLQEMMSVPCMQLSRAMLYCADDLTPQEKQMIAEYIPGYEAYLNSPGISDSMKNSFDSGRFSENPFEFIKLWAGVGLKCPLTYIDAFARLTIGLWYPDMNYRDYGAYHPYWDYDSAKQDANGSFIIVDRYTPEAFQGLADFYSELTYENPYQNIPVVSMLFSSGLTVWLCLLYFAWCLYGKHYRHLPICAFILGLWLTLLLGPVVVYRYVYPLVVVIPLLAGSALTTKTYPEKKENKNG